MSPTAKEMEIFRKNCQRDGVVYFDIESALRNNIISNLVGAGKSAPTRESLHAEWMAQEKWLDWSNFLLHKLTGQAPSDLRRAWEDGRDAAQEVAQHWAKSPSCENHSDNPCCHVRTGAGIAAKIGKLKWPGESAPATHDNLSCAVCGKGMELVSGDPRAFYKCSSCGSDPELTAGGAGSPAPGWQIYKSLAEKVEDGEVSIDSLCDGSYSGSPAPAPTYVGVDFGRGKDATGYHCSVCGDSLKPCEHWVKFEAAPAPTEEK